MSLIWVTQIIWLRKSQLIGTYRQPHIFCSRTAKISGLWDGRIAFCFIEWTPLQNLILLSLTSVLFEPLDLQIMERVQISNFRGPVLMNRRNEMGGVRLESIEVGEAIPRKTRMEVPLTFLQHLGKVEIRQEEPRGEGGKEGGNFYFSSRRPN